MWILTMEGFFCLLSYTCLRAWEGGCVVGAKTDESRWEIIVKSPFLRDGVFSVQWRMWDPQACQVKSAFYGSIIWIKLK